MLVNLKIEDYINLLGSKEPAPGGGSAAALSGSQGSALVAMVCELTIGKKKYVEYNDLNVEVLEKVNESKNKFLKFIDKDTEAFNGVSAVFSMPKETDEDKANRKTAMQKALKEAVLVPFEVMEETLVVTKLANELIGKSNTNALSDIGVGVLNFDTCIKGAWLNVLINLSSIKDEEFVKEYKEKGLKLLNETSKLANDIYIKIEKELV